jgi:hypothetical protein
VSGLDRWRKSVQRNDELQEEAVTQSAEIVHLLKAIT